MGESVEGGARDRVLLVLLFGLNVVSAFTTVVGARMVLPWPMSDVLGLAVQAMLFLALSGYVAAHAPLRRWLVVGVFSFVSVYTSFFAYYDQLAGASLDSANTDRARQAHARFVDAVWQPQQAEVDALERKAAASFALAEREGKVGVTTGRVGYGPKARQYAEEARQLEVTAAERRADLERLRPRFEVDATAFDAQALYLWDLETWQSAPDGWKAEAPLPTRAEWLDLEQEVAMITPFSKVSHGETPALAALLLALMVDGTSIVLGTAVTRRRAGFVPTVQQQVVTALRQVKDAGAAVHGAWARPGELADPEPPGLLPARLVLRVTGRGTDFLGAVYEALHPETHVLDAGRLLDHPDPTFRIAARVLLDRLRDPAVGWIGVARGRWTVVRYDALTAWLAEQYRAACEAEARTPHAPAESYLTVHVPSAPPPEEPAPALVPVVTT
jgi:hypothetical protein